MPIINTVIAGGGTTPTGTKNITTNGTHDVAAYEYADVQVPTTAPALYRAFGVDASGQLIASRTDSNVMDFTGVKTIPDYFLIRAYYDNTAISGPISLCDIETVGTWSCNRMFYYCSNITSLDWHSLKTIGGTQYSCQEMFSHCTGLVSADLSSLEEITSEQGCEYMFSGCSNLESVDLRSLRRTTKGSALARAFNNTKITKMKFCSLKSIFQMCFASAFYQCQYLTEVSFFALQSLTGSFGTPTNHFSNMLSGCTNVTVRFPIALQATIGSWSDVTNGFGGTNTTVLFDIVTSLTGADTNTYTRQEKDSTSTATAWVYNSTLYYTSGTTEPVVGDTIYSDAACTTAVTTISAIA